jgi:hypothetical protein
VLALAGCGGDEEEPAEVFDPAQTRTLAAGTARAAVLADLRRTVLADARARRARGELDSKPFRGATCEPARDDEELPADASVVRYSCLAYTLRVNTDPPQIIGKPFVARVDFASASYAWCLFLPVGGEGAHTAGTFDRPPDPRCTER